MMKGQKRGSKKMNRVEVDFSCRKGRGIYVLTFFNNLRKNLEEVP